MIESLKVRFVAGEQTGDLATYVLNRLSDEELDTVEVQREYDRDPQTANEPITIGIVLTIAIGAEATVAGIKAVQSISEALKAYIEYRTKKLGQANLPELTSEKMQIVILDGAAPQAIKSLQGTDRLAITVTDQETASS
jgi:hypothetical protein